MINKLKGKLDWKIIIDDLDDSYDIVLQELKQKVDNKSLVNSIKQKNVGKFKSIINFLNHFKNNNWIVNIDDDDLIINYKFEKFLFKLDSFGDEVNSVLTPSFISNKSIFKDIFNKKNKQFLKYNYQKISYLFFKEKFGDVDSTIFFRRFHINMNLFKDIENDKFTSESLLWLDLFPNNDILIVNNHLVYSEYLPMGLTQETRLNRISNPVSAVAVYRKFLESKKFFFLDLFLNH